MRLIDADKLLDTLGIDSLDCEKCSWSNFDYCKRGSDFVDACSAIEDAPTVDAVPLEDYKSMERTVNKLTKAIAEAEPVKHGHWCVTQAYPHTIYCSECFQRFAQAHWAVWEDGSLPRDYCPNCGAKMDGERREDE